MKRSLLMLALLVLALPVYADTICGEQTTSDNDCDSNTLAYSESCCGPGFRHQGVVYNDLKGQDNTDAIGAVCRHVKNGNIEISSDFYNRGNNGNKQPQQYYCANDQILVGVACKDLPGNDDALDGCTAMCQTWNKTNKGGAPMIMDNPDLTSNPRDYVYHTVSLPNRIAGIGYKEERKKTDRADCANVSYKHELIVKP